MECKKFSKVWAFEWVTTSPTYARSKDKPKGCGYHETDAQKMPPRKDGTPTSTVDLLKYRNAPVAGLKLTPAQMRI